jgi:hypothetical protein
MLMRWLQSQDAWQADNIGCELERSPRHAAHLCPRIAHWQNCSRPGMRGEPLVIYQSSSKFPCPSVRSTHLVLVSLDVSVLPSSLVSLDEADSLLFVIFKQFKENDGKINWIEGLFHEWRIDPDHGSKEMGIEITLQMAYKGEHERCAQCFSYSIFFLRKKKTARI